MRRPEAKGLADQAYRRRARGRTLSDLRDLTDDDLNRVSVRRLLLAEAPVSLILRVVLMMLLRVLRLREFSALKRERLRQDIVRLVSDLASGGDYDSGYVEPEFPSTPLPPPAPMAPSATPLVEIKPEPPRPAPAAAAALPEVREISGSELAGKLTAEELRMFERTAGRNLKHLFEDALHVEYRQSLTRMFGGPISVQIDVHQAHSPRLRIRFQGTHECVLPDDRDRMVASNPGALSRDDLDEAAAHLWELWKAASRPRQFDVGVEEPAEAA